MKLNFLIVFSMLSVMSFGQGVDFKFNAEADLNSDGKIDKITLKEVSEDGISYQLTVNEKSISGYLYDIVDGFILVDMNTSDKFREIAVHTPGPSDDDVYMIYWYDGKDIFFMDSLFRWPAYNGNGIVYVDDWEGFWKSRDKYVLDNQTRKLKFVEQPAYYVGVKTTVEKGFTIYLDRQLKTEVALLAVGSEIEILLCDKKGKEYYDYLYLIKSSSGLTGWTDFRNMEDKVLLNMAD